MGCLLWDLVVEMLAIARLSIMRFCSLLLAVAGKPSQKKYDHLHVSVALRIA